MPRSGLALGEPCVSSTCCSGWARAGRLEAWESGGLSLGSSPRRSVRLCEAVADTKGARKLNECHLLPRGCQLKPKFFQNDR